MSIGPIVPKLPKGVHIKHVGDIENKAIGEASGLAASNLRSDVLWVINDSGDKPFIYAMGVNGSDLGFVRVEGAVNIDWEDLAAFTYNDTPYILIADVGDNLERREIVTLYIVKEPRIQPARYGKARSVKLEWKIDFRYENAPRDCEAVSVDTKNRRIFLITKRTVPPMVYQLPLFPSRGPSISTAEKVAELAGITKMNTSGIRFNTMLNSFKYAPTAMDIAPDGLAAAILTYHSVYLFSLTPGEDWVRILSGKAVKVPIPRLYQAEALCFGMKWNHLFFTSEKLPAPLYRMDIDRSIVQ